MPAPLTAELIGRTSIAPGIAELSFKMRDPPRLVFAAGQFVSIDVAPPPGTPDAPTRRRSYSIASQSDAGDVLRFIIRVIPEGTASEYLMSMPLGTPVSLTGPYGFFVLDAAHRGDVVFGATGTGIAAVMPMLGELARRVETPRQRQRRLVFWGLRRQDDVFARDEIESLVVRAGAELRVSLTAPGPSWTGARGRITAPLLDALTSLEAPTFYLVGNGAMIAELKRELLARGVNRKTQIRTEAFFD